MTGHDLRRALTGTVRTAALSSVAVLATPVVANANPERRVALVIGNAAYADVGALDNPLQDAKAMSASLKRLGFDVVEGYDLKYDGMRQIVGEYARKLDGAKTALVYYAGHGVSVGGENYLLPTDASLKSEADLDLKTVNIDLVTRQMQREDRTSILILDACRNNPFKEELARSVGRTRSASVGSGLAEIATKGSSGMLIAFATDPGKTALDGDKGGNSPFAAGLLKHMETPGISISTVLDRVRGDVFAATNGKQKPWTNTSLIGEFFLARAPSTEPKVQVAVGGDPAALPIPSSLGGGGTGAPAMPQTLEMRLWESAERGNTVDDYRAYLAAHPNGYFSQIARNAITRLSTPVAAVTPAQPARPAFTVSDQDLAKEVGTASTEKQIKLTPSERKEAQERLRALGMDPGKIWVGADFKPENRAAIAKWQQSRSIAETGYLTKVQKTALWEQSEVDYQKLVMAPEPVVGGRGVAVPREGRPVRAAQQQPRQQRAPRQQGGGGGGGGGGDGAAAAALFGGIAGGLIGGALGRRW